MPSCAHVHAGFGFGFGFGFAVSGYAPDALIFDLTSYFPDDPELVVTQAAAPRPANIVVARAVAEARSAPAG